MFVNSVLRWMSPPWVPPLSVILKWSTPDWISFGLLGFFRRDKPVTPHFILMNEENKKDCADSPANLW